MFQEISPQNKILLDKIIRSGNLSSASLIKAFEEIDRQDFVKSEYQDRAYDDLPLPIGYGQTISQPTTVAFMLERLQPRKDDYVLDVGSGSGWTAALLANIVGPNGKVVGTERIEALVKFGRVNLNKYGYHHADILLAEDYVGYKEAAPYDKILVSAAALEVPSELVEQLKEGGTMVIPVKSSIYKVTKTSSKDYKYDEYYGFSFVPLVSGRIEDE